MLLIPAVRVSIEISSWQFELISGFVRVFCFNVEATVKAGGLEHNNKSQ